MTRVVVVGGGVAGMTAALLCAESGSSVTVLEREAAAGGLARTFHYNGFGFDIGPHRFHTDDPLVLAFLTRILGGAGERIDRRSGVWMFKRYHDWPLRPGSLLKLPPGVLLRTAGDILRRPRSTGESFQGYILSRYGRTLYDVFFAPYTRKFILSDPAEVHRDWAAAGIDRAVIDPRIRMDSLSDLVRATLLPRPVKTEFIYPAQGGIAGFVQRLQAELERSGVIVRTGQRAIGVATEAGRVTSVTAGTGETFGCDRLVWTAPIGELAGMLGVGPTSLAFISTVCLNYEVEAEPTLPYQWCYFGQGDISFSRVSLPSLFSQSMAPPGRSGLCVEVTCHEGDSFWREPAVHLPLTEEHLRRVGAVRPSDRLRAVHVERIPNTYPVYGLGYRRELDRVRARLGSFSNLRLLGRCGTFWYNNMDHSIRAAIDLSAELAAESRGGA
jgi:protoporphyrinogen oxidase